MKTVVINTSTEAKNTKLDVLFRAPFDQNSLLWFDSELNALGENAGLIKQCLLEDTDTVDKDYQLIVLVDLYTFPLGNDTKAVAVYQMLLERYIRFSLLESLYNEYNLAPLGAAVYFVNSAKQTRGLDIHSLADNLVLQREQEVQECAEQEKRRKRSVAGRGDLCDEPSVTLPQSRVQRTEQERILMEIFGWTEATTSKDLSWKMKVSASGEDSLDFAGIFSDTSSSIAKSHKTAKVLEIALQEVLAPLESTRFTGVGRFPVYSLVCFVSRENEQSKTEGFFCLFANIFTCVQEKTLYPQLMVFEKEKIRELLIAALKKYKHFSAEENISVSFEPIAKVFQLRNAIYNARKKDARGRSEFKDKTDEEIAELIMSEGVEGAQTNHKLRGLDRTFHDLAAEIFNNYDTEVIRAQNNRIVKSCLQGLWSWRDKQTRESFRALVDQIVTADSRTPSGNDEGKLKRDTIAFIQEEYEAKQDELIDKVTDAENKLAANKNILLETKDLVLKYGDWMRKGAWSLVSFVGAIFTVIATVFPFFYTEYTIGHTGLSFWINLPTLIGFCAFLYAVAAGIYIGYIRKKKILLIHELDKLREESEAERKASIIALYHYYDDTIVEAESHSLLWREILRRDQENAKKGIKRNYHIKRLKNLAEQVERFITMLKLDAGSCVNATAADLDEYSRLGLRIDGEASYHDPENRRVYCFLPEKNTHDQPKGGTEEA